MAPDFELEGSDLIPDINKDRPTAMNVNVKIRRSESPVAGFQQFAMGIVTIKNFPAVKTQIKILEIEKDDPAIYRLRLKSIG